ncbi:MAG: hypothetical protein AAF591_17580 [Verrucomicrobiota bacterium]
MGIYLKWSSIILLPALIAGVFIFYQLHQQSETSVREDLDRSYDAQQIKRLERQRAEKARLDQEYQRKQRQL